MTRFLLAAAFFLAASTATFAAQTFVEDCTKIKGDVVCDDPVGNSEASGGQSQSTTTTDQGSLNNPSKFQCSGPGNGNSDAGC